MSDLIKIDHDFLRREALLTTVMFDLFITQSHIFYKRLEAELSVIGLNNADKYIVEIQERLRQERLNALRSGIKALADRRGIEFDIDHTIQFMEEYMVANRRIETVGLTDYIAERAELVLSKKASEAGIGPGDDAFRVLENLRNELSQRASIVVYGMDNQGLSNLVEAMFNMEDEELVIPTTVYENPNPQLSERRATLKVVK